MLAFARVFDDIAVTARAEGLHCAALRRQSSEVRIHSGAPFTCTTDVLTHCNRSKLVVLIKVWVDHMVDHLSTYIYQKRGFYYFSRRLPKVLLAHCSKPLCDQYAPIIIKGVVKNVCKLFTKINKVNLYPIFS